MKALIASSILMVLVSAGVSAQKGIDTQTQKIKDDTNKTTSRETDVTRSFDWGKGKTQTRERLANPYQLNARRDVLVEMIQQVLREKKIVIDEPSSRLNDGIIITQPFVFGKGPTIATAELKRYGILEFADTAWSRGQYSLTIEVQSIDGVKNNVSVNAKVEGRSGTGLTTEWVTVRSSGLAEEEFLTKLVEAVTGRSLDEPQTIDQE
ncbi:MAG: hypothetical protein JNK51_07025 [Blastocatellia bacterium]|mgnify:CR=1 FL=1|nr:hypothetical protein [Chloracidobacterium sp.]MBL8184662.1 hypothetical protein [Blastocatellia bacterium]HRJ87555.1 hypothetical protein [Pyrinomonadaceae bacterium]HRK50512.1 hypothetical protein [Pyrinomonadaceae bacterium]